ncbi:MAG TPA: DUF6036 family nucleotidyltransferase [Candidatus Thermoplasmatota archaeon]
MEAGTSYFLGELSRAGERMERPLTVYLVGGGAMAIRLLKAQTKDLDLVVADAGDARVLTAALEGVHYVKQVRLARAYRDLHASAVLDNRDGFRIDLFTRVICRALEFGASMEARSETYDLGSRRLTLRLASPEDILVLKAVTDRPRDMDDMATIARQGVDWQIIAGEMLGQRRTGGKFFLPVFIQSLEQLEQEFGVRVPILPRLLVEVEADLDEIEAMTRKVRAESARKRARRGA